MKKILLLFLAIFLFAKNINTILSKIEIKNDLSLKTRRENCGVSYIFTRRDLDSLQINHLKDLLILTPINYKINRYGIIDMFNPNSNIPFLSSYVKIFIDNQEITSGLYGSGLAILGDIDLGWVDHAEIYTQAPSFDVSTEPALIIIKLYSKTPQRDEGKNLHISGSTYKSTYDYFTFAKELNKYSFFTYFGYNKEGNKKINNLKNNKIIKHFLFTFHHNNSNFIFDIHSVNRNGLFGFSLDANPQKNNMNKNSFHIGYDDKVDNFSFLLSLDYTKAKTFYLEKPILFYLNSIPIYKTYITSTDYSLNTKLIYKKNFNRHDFIIGIKNRFKHFSKYNKLLFNNFNLPQYGHTRQNISSIFLQDSYFLSLKSVVNFGLNYSYITNNANVKDRKLKQFRLSHTYLKNKFTFKTVFSHIEYSLDPYLINSFFVKGNDLKPTKIDSIFEDIKYKDESYRFEFLIGKFISKDYMFPDNQGQLINIKERMNELYLGLKSDFYYMPFSKFAVHLFFHKLNNIPKFKTYRYYKYVFYNYNQMKKVNLFEELVIDKFTKSKYFPNFSLGAKYNYNDSLTFFAKGENLLNRAYKETFFRINPLTLQREEPVRYQLINRGLTLGMEYIF